MTYVFKWKVRTQKWENRPEADHLARVMEENAFFWQYWVPGAEGYLTYNVNPALALVNGAPVTTHSLTFQSEKEFCRVLSLVQGAAKQTFGTEVIIEEPLSVNVRMNKSLDGKPLSTKRKLQLKELKKWSLSFKSEQQQLDEEHTQQTETASDDEQADIVIPITEIPADKESWDTLKFKNSLNPLTPLGRVQIRDALPFELAFSMTAHKAQGRTIRRVVLDLSERPNCYEQMKFAAIFVGMSRVQFSDHMRLLKHKLPGVPYDREKDHSYLTELRPDPDVTKFYAGYQKNGSAWNPKP